MFRNLLLATCLIGLFAVWGVSSAEAQCATCGTPTMAYSPVAVSAYQPVAVQSGWYPGYWFDRMRAQRWGARTVVAARPVAYSAYQPMAVASGCSTCAQRVVMRPAVTCWDPCNSCGGCDMCSSCDSCSSFSPCSTCGTSPCSCGSGVALGSSIHGADCAGCSGGSGVTVPSTAPQGYGENSQPALRPEEEPREQRTFRSKPATEPDASFSPSDDYDSSDYESSADGVSGPSTLLKAPKLFSPKDRTTQRVTAPIWTTVYRDPIKVHRVSGERGASRPATRAQAERDASGWTTAR